MRKSLNLFTFFLLTVVMAMAAYSITRAVTADTVTLSINSTTFQPGQAWTLTISGSSNQPVNLCAWQTRPDGSPQINYGCSSIGTTNASGVLALSGTFQAVDAACGNGSCLGVWGEYAEIGGVQSNTIVFNINSNISLTLNGSTADQAYSVGTSWTLRISSNLPNQDVTICAVHPNSAQNCTPAANLGFAAKTDMSGNWKAGGTFTSADTGSWSEWATILGDASDNIITFTVSVSGGSGGSGGTTPTPTPTPTPTGSCSQTNCSACTQAQCASPGCAWTGTCTPTPPNPGDPGTTACTNPSPALTGYALPCPTLNVTPASVGATGSFTVNVTKGNVSYIYRTIYINQGATTWKRFPSALTSANASALINANWAIGDVSYTTTPQAAVLASGLHGVATWDWTYDAFRSTATSPCWLGPGSTTCNTGGKWRVQTFTVL